MKKKLKYENHDDKLIVFKFEKNNNEEHSFVFIYIFQVTLCDKYYIWSKKRVIKSHFAYAKSEKKKNAQQLIKIFIGGIIECYK